MKKNSAMLVLLFAAVILGGCKKSGSGTPDLTPVVTPVGTIDGAAKTQTIGSAGGTIVSADGEMELVIPAGALTANTDITIQPITNNAPNGRRKAYRCTPDGQQFAKNITVKFHYTDEDAAATAPDYMMMAFQTDDGTWQVLDDITNDVAGTTITASVNHFTDFTAFDVMRIDPATLYLKTGEKGQYLVTATGMSVVNGARLLNQLEDNPETWKVNGLTGGNSTHGTIERIGNESKAEYTAPATMPATNPVSISVEMNFSFIIDGQQFNRGILTARAYIIGNRYQVELEYKGNSAVGTGEEFRVDDNVRMTINLVGTEGNVTGAINVPPTFTKTANSTNGCNTTFTSNGTGPINLRDIDAAGVQRNGITGDVYVFFNSDVGVVPAVMQIVCPTSTQTKDFLPWSSAGAVLTFKDNGQLQVIDMSQVSSQSIKLIVTPLQ
jgi:hypothetical protein